MKTMIVVLMLGMAACASTDRTPTPEPNRNVMAGGVGVASLLTDCGDGVQRDTRGAGVGFMLTSCLKERERVAPSAEAKGENPMGGVGIVSIGLGLAVTISDCGGFRLTGLGIGLGVVAAPCPRAPQPKNG